MNRRTLYLLAGAACVLLLYGGDMAYRTWYEEPRDALDRRLTKLTKDLSKARTAEVAGKKDSKQLSFLTAYSLPYDLELATSEYQDWLLQVAKRNQLEDASVDASAPRPITVKARVKKGQREVAHRIGFGLRARTDLQHVTSFLYEFYEAGHLHKITDLAITPRSGGREIDVTLSIETLVLDACDRESELSQVTWDRLAGQTPDDFSILAKRNIFARGVSKSLMGIELSGITFDRKGRGEAWFAVGSARQTQIVGVGQVLVSDASQFEVTKVEPTRVSIDWNGDTIWISVGQSLGQAVAGLDPNIANVQ